MDQLLKPTPEHVRNRIAQFDEDDRYYGGERAVGLVFEQWPRNVNYEEVVVKATVLNRIYSTSIYDIWTVAQRILDLNIDDRLTRGDESLIHEIAEVEIKGARRFNLSFATKYCSWHQPNLFQVYDSYVDWLLWLYAKQYRFRTFRRYNLRDYPTFVAIVDAFRTHFGLEEFTRRQFDKFLWIEGREMSEAGSPAIVETSDDRV